MTKRMQPDWAGDADDDSGGQAPEPVSKRASVGSLRVLCVDESELSSVAFRELDHDFDVVVEQSAVEALAALERGGDFAVIVTATEAARAAATAKFLEAARAISPTTARVVLTTAAAPDAEDSFDTAFRVISAPASAGLLHDAVSQALAYHRLLVTSPAQPVEADRFERPAILPPARSDGTQQKVPVFQGLLEAAGHLAAEPALIRDQALSVLGLVLDVSPRIGLHWQGRTIELLRGDTIVGRSRTCHIPIPDPRISRRHARFSNDGRSVIVQNLSSKSAVSVNGGLLEPDAARPLLVGDRLLLGAQEIEVCALGDYCPSFEPTEQVSITRPSEGPHGSTLATLARVAEKYFALGQNKEAERISKPLLAGLLRFCDDGQVPTPADVELAVSLTLRIAESNRGGEWIDYLFDLFSALERPMNQEVVDRLYRLIPEAQGVKMACFRRYADALLEHLDRFGPAERFLVRRIQGLETALMMSAHV